MTKIFVDYNKLNSNVLTNIDSALYNLKKSVYGEEILNIPYDFEYAKYLKDLYNNNLSNYNELKKIRDNIDKIVNMYKKIERENIISINSIKNTNIQSRNNVVM